MKIKLIILTTFLLMFSMPVYAQQVADSTFIPQALVPGFTEGNGPVVFIDEAHNNFHTESGRFGVFAKLLRADGYEVKPAKEKISRSMLNKCSIYVISNAIGDENVENWDKPNHSAFTENEVTILNKWVNDGGKLLLIADHMPMPAAAGQIAASFGVEFNNGYAMKQDGSGGPDFFTRESGTLLDHSIIRGRTNSERITSFTTFTGQAFTGGRDLEPILRFPAGYVSFMPEKSWDLNAETKKIKIAGWLQGGVMKYGMGRAAFFGEAASFTAQLAGGRAVGLNHPNAKQNSQFVLNVMHWLSGVIEN